MAKLGRNDPCFCGSGKKYKKCHWGEPVPDVTSSRSFQEIARPLVLKGTVSPMSIVPDHIEKPSYAVGGRPTEKRARTCVKSAEEIERMRTAGKVARTVLDHVLESVQPGMTTDELDQIAHKKCIELGAYPSPLNYHGFPKSLCTSVNEIVCHGIPDDRVLLEGDIINCDVTIYIGGMHGDCSETVFVGKPDAEAIRLVSTTYDCMMRGIEAACVGASLNEIGKAITKLAHKERFSVVRDFAGHGIGTQFHQDPQIVHYPEPRQRQRIEPNMTFTIEPMINEGDFHCKIWSDDWTASTSDAGRSAQFEHTILVTRSGYELLTGGDKLPYFKRQLEAWGLN